MKNTLSELIVKINQVNLNYKLFTFGSNERLSVVQRLWFTVKAAARRREKGDEEQENM